MPYQIDRIMEIADRYGIPVIEDAAEGFGSRFNEQVLGTFGKYLKTHTEENYVKWVEDFSSNG